MNTLNPLQQRSLAVAILIALLLIIYGLIIGPIMARYQAANDQIDSLSFQIAKYQAIAESRQQATLQLKQLRQQNDRSGYLLKGRTPALLSANLQQHLKKLVARSGGELIRVQPLRHDNSQLPSISLRVQVRADVTQLLKQLYALENGQPLLTISQITVTANPVRKSSYAKKSVIQPLDIRFQLTGYSDHGEAL
mgnify:CR=1 FL=1